MRFHILLVLSCFLPQLLGSETTAVSQPLDLFRSTGDLASSLLATREHMRQHLDDLPPALHIGPWYCSQGFKSDDPEAVHPPEQQLDASALGADGVTLWTPQPGWGFDQELPTPWKREQTGYGMVSLRSAAARTVGLVIDKGHHLSGEGSLLLSLNGRELARYTSDKQAEPLRIPLHLEQGDNLLLLKIRQTSWRAVFHLTLDHQDPEQHLRAAVRSQYPALAPILLGDLDSAGHTLSSWLTQSDPLPGMHDLLALVLERLGGALEVTIDHQIFRGQDLGSGLQAYLAWAAVHRDLDLLPQGARAAWQETILDAAKHSLGGELHERLARFYASRSACLRTIADTLQRGRIPDTSALADVLAEARALDPDMRRLRSQLLARTWSGPDLSGDQWAHNPSRNPLLSAQHLPAAANDSNRLWERELGRLQYSFPTAAAGRLFVGCERRAFQDERLDDLRFGGAVLCLDQRTGELQWEIGFDLPMLPDISRNSRYGICSSAVVEGDRVYLVTARGLAVCLDLAGMANGNDGWTGEFEQGRFAKFPGGPEQAARELAPHYGDVLWYRDVIGEIGSALHDAYAGTVLLQGDQLWVSTSHSEGAGNELSHLVPGKESLSIGDRPCLVVLDKHSGTIIAQDDLHIREVFHGQWSSPSMGVVDGQPQFYYGDGYGYLHAFAAPEPVAGEIVTLEELWRIDCNPPAYRRRDGYEILYEGPRGETNGMLHGPSEIIATPVFHRGRVYVAIGRDERATKGEGNALGMLTCIDAGGRGDVTGSAECWSYPIGRTMCTPALVDDLLFIGDYRKQFSCLDADTGQLHWQHELDNIVLYSSPLVADGKVYFLSHKGTLYIFEASKEKKLLFSGKVGRGGVMPTALDHLLFIPTDRSIAAFRGPSLPDTTR